MAARNRPRNGLMKDDAPDAHEERTMWNSIVTELRSLKTIQARAAEVAKQQVELEIKIAKLPSLRDLDELEKLYREAVKLAEEEEKVLSEDPHDVIKNIGLLSALRTASEMTEPVRLPSGKARNPKRQKLESDSTVDTPVASPGPTIPKNKGQYVRSVSIPRAQPDPVVKMEDAYESVKAEKAGKFVIGAEVAYKQAKPKPDGSQWIQCNIINITGEGSKKRYEVQDPEPDENGHPGGQVFKTSAAAMIAIPGPEAILPDFLVGKDVLARYPETTTFYRAEVTGSRKGYYQLKFEDDQNQELEVPRRYVLEVSGK